MFRFSFLITIFFSLLTSPKASQQPLAIFHAFNMKYTDIMLKIDEIAQQGYSHIQISPAQKFRDTVPHTEKSKGIMKPEDLWYLAYQPVDFLTINNRYGNEKELLALTQKAHQKGLSIIADVVFNHVAALNGLEREEWKASFSPHSLTYRENLLKLHIYPGLSMANCVKNGYKDKFLSGDSKAHKICMKDFTEWEDCKERDKSKPDTKYTCWMDGALPSLKPSCNVIKIHEEHIMKLINLGVRGFRFDAVKNIHPNTLETYVTFIDEKEKSAYSYLEFVGDTKEENLQKAEIAPVTDFVFLNKLKDIFRYGGDLRGLRHSDYDTRKYILFVENHDTAANRIDPSKGINNRIADKKDMELALTYILARHGGVPLILAENAEAPHVPSGVLFRRIMDFSAKASAEKVKEPEFIYDIPQFNSENIMVMVRENGNGIYFLNKSGQNKRVVLNDSNKNNFPNVLKEIFEKKYVIITDSKIPNPQSFDTLTTELSIPARSVVYLVKHIALQDFENSRKN